MILVFAILIICRLHVLSHNIFMFEKEYFLLVDNREQDRQTDEFNRDEWASRAEKPSGVAETGRPKNRTNCFFLSLIVNNLCQKTILFCLFIFCGLFLL